MNYSPINLTKVGLFLTAASSLFLIAKPSQAVIANLLPSDFIADPDNNTGRVNNNASFSGGINTTLTSNGFNDGSGGFFTSNYLLLGGNLNSPPATEASNIGASKSNGDSSAITGDSDPLTDDTFFINAFDGSNGVTVEFDWAFQGTNPTSDKDEFTVSLINTTDTSTYEVLNVSSPDYALVSGYSQTFTNLTEGNYLLGITLNEAGGNPDSLNTAAGFNNISVYAVPFEFSPTQGLLAVGGLWGISAYLKRRKAAAMLNADLAS